MMRITPSWNLMFMKHRCIAAGACKLPKNAGDCSLAKFNPFLLTQQNTTIKHGLDDTFTKCLGIRSIHLRNLEFEELHDTINNCLLLEVGFMLTDLPHPRCDSAKRPRLWTPVVINFSLFSRL